MSIELISMFESGYSIREITVSLEGILSSEEVTSILWDHGYFDSSLDSE